MPITIDVNKATAKDRVIRLQERISVLKTVADDAGLLAVLSADLALAGLPSDFNAVIPYITEKQYVLEAILIFIEGFMHTYGLYGVEGTPPTVELYFEDVLADLDAALTKFQAEVDAAFVANSASIVIYFKRRLETTSKYLDIMDAIPGDRSLDLSMYKHVLFKSVNGDTLTIRRCNILLNENFEQFIVEDTFIMPQEILPYTTVGAPAAAFDGTGGLFLKGGSLSSATWGGGLGMSARRMEINTVVTSSAIKSAQLNYTLKAPLGLTFRARDLILPINSDGSGVVELAAGTTNIVDVKGARITGSSATTALFTCPDGVTVSFKQLTIVHDYYSTNRARYKLLDGKDLADYQIDNAYFGRTPGLDAGTAITRTLQGWFPVDTAGDPVAHYQHLTLDNIHFTNSFNDEVKADIASRLVMDSVHLVRGTVNPFITMISNCLVQMVDCDFGGSADWPVIAEDSVTTPTVNVIVNSSRLQTGLTQWLEAGSSGAVGDNVENGIVVGLGVGVPKQEEFTGEVAPVNADTILGLTLTTTPGNTDSVVVFVNGSLVPQTWYSVGGTGNKKITWLGATPPGTGQASYALTATDEIVVVYRS